ncbi:MAG: restriction endonuclease subunit S [Deltaproteobacteria bacterium]|nr:restriction endonuclease subunit S [Deltaproteobacteria bacterium]MCL5277617.1 restriction endonuclease subunit S [Deltaproteobacteria bacterium]
MIRNKQSSIGKILRKWDVQKISDVFVVETGTTPSTKRSDYWLNGKVNWLTPSDLSKLNGKIEIVESERKITEKALKENNLTLMSAGSIIISTRAPVGYVAILKQEATFNQGCKGLVVKESGEVFSKFYCYYLLHQKNKLQNLSSGSTFKELSKDRLESLEVPLPPLPEQKKIAEVLSTVDEAIQKVEEAIGRAERLKKGLMQELLTKGIAHKEFKDTEIGTIPKEWEVVELSKIGDIVTGTTPSTNINEFWGEGYPFVTPTDFADDKYVFKTERSVTKSGAEQGRLIPKNSIMVVCIASVGEVAMTSTECITNQQINTIVCNRGVDPHYIYYEMVFRKRILKRWAGITTSPIIKKSSFEKFPIPLPPLPEQKKIAEVLSTVDQKLELLRERKERFTRLKNGLMNELLTGEKRVRLN